MSEEAPKPDGRDPLRFEVPSDSEPLDYVVDLGSWGGFGECGCPDHQIRNLPLIREGDRDPRLRCKHLRRARESFADSMIARILKVTTRENDEEQN
jgi:hypothetical protein